MWGQENCFEKTNLVLVVFTWNLAWSTRQSNKYQVRNETARINNKNMEWCWYALLACNRHRQLALKWWSPIREASVSYFIHEIKCYSFFSYQIVFSSTLTPYITFIFGVTLQEKRQTTICVVLISTNKLHKCSHKKQKNNSLTHRHNREASSLNGFDWHAVIHWYISPAIPQTPTAAQE